MAAGEAADTARRLLGWGVTRVVHGQRQSFPSLCHTLELRLTCSQREDTDAVDVSVESRMRFSGSQHGVDGPTPSRSAITLEPPLVGEKPATWRVQFGDDRLCGSTNLRVMSRGQVRLDGRGPSRACRATAQRHSSIDRTHAEDLPP